MSKTVQDIRDKKAALEGEITAFLSKKLDEFTDETGLTAEGLSVDFHQVSYIGGITRVAIGNVNLDVRI